ncbi:MAG: CvpA family protein [Eubacteriaceae bacterium]|nr:CvpA family protein [Eubacteriaceae bacterium]
MTELNINLNIPDILFCVLIIYNAFSGARQGFVRTASAFLKYIAAFLSAKIFYKSLAEYLTVNSGIYRVINENITNAISSVSLEEATTDKIIEIFNIEFVPEPIKLYIEDLVTKSHLSLQGFAEYFSENLSMVIYEAMCFIIVFILTLILWKIMTLIVDRIMGLPVLKQVNGLGGFAVGLLKGLFLCVVASSLLYTLSMMDMPALSKALEGSYLAKYFYIGSILNL